MSKEDRLRDSNVVRVDPDDVVVLSLVEVKELLLNGVLRIPSISNEGHRLDQHGWMATHNEAPSQTNNLPRGKICHLKQKEEFANASDYEETWNDSDNIAAVIVRKVKILTTRK